MGTGAERRPLLWFFLCFLCAISRRSPLSWMVRDGATNSWVQIQQNRVGVFSHLAGQSPERCLAQTDLTPLPSSEPFLPSGIFTGSMGKLASVSRHS